MQEESPNSVRDVCFLLDNPDLSDLDFDIDHSTSNCRIGKAPHDSICHICCCSFALALLWSRVRFAGEDEAAAPQE